jgi:hypothetical protein
MIDLHHSNFIQCQSVPQPIRGATISTASKLITRRRLCHRDHWPATRRRFTRSTRATSSATADDRPEQAPEPESEDGIGRSINVIWVEWALLMMLLFWVLAAVAGAELGVSRRGRKVVGISLT